MRSNLGPSISIILKSLKDNKSNMPTTSFPRPVLAHI